MLAPPGAASAGALWLCLQHNVCAQHLLDLAWLLALLLSLRSMMLDAEHMLWHLHLYM
jgi:hypothetical protein